MTLEFQSFPKIPRKFGDVVVTEKLDGTNAQVIFVESSSLESEQDRVRATELSTEVLYTDDPGNVTFVMAGSRNRYVQPGKDNFGFAAYVKQNAQALYDALGVGKHFGEWFGAGIQRRYGLDQKRFALFNTRRWQDHGHPDDGHTNEVFFKRAPVDYMGVPGLTVVPVLHIGPLNDVKDFTHTFGALRAHGSYAVPGYDNPEGIVVCLTATGHLFKITDAAEPKPPKSQRRADDLPPGE